METVEVVVRIPKGTLETVKECVKENRTYLIDALYEAVANGTVLPKGHGRLIDADAVLEEPFGNTYKDIDIAETIIEADKEAENEKHI